VNAIVTTIGKGLAPKHERRFSYRVYDDYEWDSTPCEQEIITGNDEGEPVFGFEPPTCTWGVWEDTFEVEGVPHFQQWLEFECDSCGQVHGVLINGTIGDEAVGLVHGDELLWEEL
jgi:hypothetical protein